MSALAECVLTCFAFIVRSFTSSRFNFPFISGTPSSFSRRGPSPAQKSAMLRPKSFLDGQETYPFKLLNRMAVKIHQWWSIKQFQQQDWNRSNVWCYAENITMQLRCKAFFRWMALESPSPHAMSSYCDDMIELLPVSSRIHSPKAAPSNLNWNDIISDSGCNCSQVANPNTLFHILQRAFVPTLSLKETFHKFQIKRCRDAKFISCSTYFSNDQIFHKTPVMKFYVLQGMTPQLCFQQTSVVMDSDGRLEFTSNQSPQRPVNHPVNRSPIFCSSECSI